MNTHKKVFIAAGEASSDFHASRLVLELKKLLPGVDVFGMGGRALRDVGARTIVDSETSASVMGFSEVVGSLGKIIRAFKTLERGCRAEKPDLAILVDYPDFNLRLAKKLHLMGIPVLYFISPQMWAWRSGRVHHVRRYIKKVATIFPFEDEFYHRHGVDAEYVGHPLVETIPTPQRVEVFRESQGIDSGRPVLALLPGSRRAEISRLLSSMRDAAVRLRDRYPELQIVLPVAPGLSQESLEREYALSSASIRVVQGGARELLSLATIAVVASGTATVEAALAGVPTVVVYRLSSFSYRLAKLLVRGVNYFAMPNLICGEKVVQELLQDEVTGARIAAEVDSLLSNPTLLAMSRQRLSAVREKLSLGRSGEGAGARVAAIAYKMINEAESAPKAIHG